MCGLSQELYNAIRKDAVPLEVTVEDRPYTTQNIHPVKEPEPGMLEVQTLTGFIDFVKTNIDNLQKGKTFIHVVNHEGVLLRSALHGPFLQRDVIIRAVAKVPIRFNFGSYYDSESFNIALQANFLPTEDRDLMLRYVGNIQDSNVKTINDDGISQEITTKTGIATVENVRLPNPVLLRPYRTFNEIEQPASLFVFRAKRSSSDAPGFALYEADNKAWESVAMQSVKAYLAEALPDIHIIA
ncbi:MAG: hypothetical protein LBB40_01665 [Holophagales bacterium]|jgi:hypothetical protein|nr:hypothetical protein [Holophagales bacterium]